MFSLFQLLQSLFLDWISWPGWEQHVCLAEWESFTKWWWKLVEWKFLLILQWKISDFDCFLYLQIYTLEELSHYSVKTYLVFGDPFLLCCLDKYALETSVIKCWNCVQYHVKTNCSHQITILHKHMCVNFKNLRLSWDKTAKNEGHLFSSFALLFRWTRFWNTLLRLHWWILGVGW